MAAVRVRVIIEEIDSKGNVEEVNGVVLGQFNEDEDNQYKGMEADNFFNEVVRDFTR